MIRNNNVIRLLVNRLYGIVFGIWVMMILDPETYRGTSAHIIISFFVFYFLIFGDTHFCEYEKKEEK